MPAHGHPLCITVSKLLVSSAHHSSHPSNHTLMRDLIKKNAQNQQYRRKEPVSMGQKCYRLTCAMLFALRVLRASNPTPSEATVHFIHQTKYKIRIPDQMSSTDMKSASCFSLMVVEVVVSVCGGGQGITGKFFLLCPIPITFFIFSLNPKHTFLFLKKDACLI